MRIPTPEETRNALAPEQIALYEKIGQQLQQSHGETPPGFHLTGWLWKNMAEAEIVCELLGVTQAAMAFRFCPFSGNSGSVTVQLFSPGTVIKERFGISTR